MPIYEYRCGQGHTFEVLQRMSDDPVSNCETCDAPVERVFRPVAVHFKGSGFYNTDYGTRKRAREKEAAEGNGKPAKDESGSKSGGDSKAGSESKPSSEPKSSDTKGSPAPK